MPASFKGNLLVQCQDSTTLGQEEADQAVELGPADEGV